MEALRLAGRPALARWTALLLLVCFARGQSSEMDVAAASNATYSLEDFAISGVLPNASWSAAQLLTCINEAYQPKVSVLVLQHMQLHGLALTAIAGFVVCFLGTPIFLNHMLSAYSNSA
jgi:hypothetical protein